MSYNKEQENIAFTSQLGQDRWVLEFLKYKPKGYFIDIGAADGIEISNTYILEKKYDWEGICIEPSRQFDTLRKNRNCICDNRVVFSHDNKEITFVEDHKHGDHNWFSGISETIDRHKIDGVASKKTTISLDTLLKEHEAPRDIDYMTIDTEGSEYNIIETFPFDKWRIKLITIEHNNIRNKRNQIFKLLSKYGYTRDMSPNTKWDDWYYHSSLKKEYPDGIFEPRSKMEPLMNFLRNIKRTIWK